MRIEKDLAFEIGAYWDGKGLFASTMMEECGELTKAISRVARAKAAYAEASEDDPWDMKGKLDWAKLELEREMADMYITLEVLKESWALDESYIQKKIDDKLDKTYGYGF